MVSPSPVSNRCRRLQPFVQIIFRSSSVAGRGVGSVTFRSLCSDNRKMSKSKERLDHFHQSPPQVQPQLRTTLMDEFEVRSGFSHWLAQCSKFCRDCRGVINERWPPKGGTGISMVRLNAGIHIRRLVIPGFGPDHWIRGRTRRPATLLQIAQPTHRRCHGNDNWKHDKHKRQCERGYQLQLNVHAATDNE